MSPLNTPPPRPAEAPGLFRKALADRWALLPSEVRALHAEKPRQTFTGRADIRRGSSLLARIAASFFGFPDAGTDVPLRLTKTRSGQHEVWERDFDGRILRSHFAPAPGRYRYRERFWWLSFELDLPVENGEMRLPVRRGWFLGVPVPRALLPVSDSREFARHGRFHFDIALNAPFGAGLIVHYRGSLVPDDGD